MNLEKQFQTVVLVDENLNEINQTIQVRPGDKILSKELYAKELYEAYSRGYQITKEDADLMQQLEGSVKKTILKGKLLEINSDGRHGEMYVTPKHAFNIELPKDEDEQFEVGKEIDFSLVKHKNQISIDAKSSKFLQEKRFHELFNEIKFHTKAYDGKILDIIKNGELIAGFKVLVNEVECFMPLSESDIIFIDNADKRIGETYYVIPINFMRNNIVVSHKEFLKYKELAVRRNLLENKTNLLGTVNAIKDFGIFITIEDCISTLLPINEMNDETKVKFEANQIQVGDKIMFDIDSVNDERIIITQQTSKRDCWEQFERMIDYNVNDLCKDFAKVSCKVSTLVSSGLIAQMTDMPDVKFFVSSRFYSKLYKVGDLITLKIKSVDTNKRTVKIFD